MWRALLTDDVSLSRTDFVSTVLGCSDRSLELGDGKRPSAVYALITFGVGVESTRREPKTINPRRKTTIVANNITVDILGNRFTE